ncbi:hypothetical protein V502_06640 [Pseudogymnoascus sp. VKM F-4520 (FW-2644)]|nr:hypothetical protein V502_06640 [Pseudogymnoascus sp. VKM F-4520 (FW-2644)]
MRPVVPAICTPNYAFLNWEKPAPAMQVNNTMLKIGMIAGVIGRIRAHDWRRGAANDLANLPGGIPSTVNERVAQALGHSIDLYTARVEARHESRPAPAFLAPLLVLEDKELSSQDVAAMLATHEDRDDDKVDDDVQQIANLLRDQDDDEMNDEQEQIGFSIII